MLYLPHLLNNELIGHNYSLIKEMAEYFLDYVLSFYR